MRALLLAALIQPALLPAPRADEDGYDDTPAIQRYLVGVSLGDNIERVRRVYPPAQEWPATVETKTGVTRYRVERGGAKAFPPRVETLYFGFKNGRLVEIEVVYDEKQSRSQTVEKSGRRVRAHLRRGEEDRRPLLVVGRQDRVARLSHGDSHRQGRRACRRLAHGRADLRSRPRRPRR